MSMFYENKLGRMKIQMFLIFCAFAVQKFVENLYLCKLIILIHITSCSVLISLAIRSYIIR